MSLPGRIHFMGIGGSGMSAVAQIADSQGYKVTGCDLNLDSPYILKVKKLKLTIYEGHSPDHLKGVDLLCVTPAVFYQSSDSPELALAKSKQIVMTWQNFMGTYLHQNKYLICIAGTHGKSTTTALAGLLLEKAGLDPTVEVGATVKNWHNNVRIGKSRYFISEADEFYNNFSTYRPDVTILTLLEYDHPEYFGSYEKMVACYLAFIRRTKPRGTLIYNADSRGCRELILKIKNLKLKISLIPYSLSDFPAGLNLSQPGNHNKLNALAILNLAKVLNISRSDLNHVFRHFSGLERRLELLGEKNGIKVYDDYANHPSSFAATISALRELYPKRKLTAVIEPHTFSRLRAMQDKLPRAVKDADKILVSRIFASREKDPGDFSGRDIVNAMHHPHAGYIPEFTDIISYLVSHKSSLDIILVMGSGNSYKLAREILKSL
jgi:UDP-N-acetylmuramate--alanine ligase